MNSQGFHIKSGKGWPWQFQARNSQPVPWVSTAPSDAIPPIPLGNRRLKERVWLPHLSQSWTEFLSEPALQFSEAGGQLAGVSQGVKSTGTRARFFAGCSWLCLCLSLNCWRAKKLQWMLAYCHFFPLRHFSPSHAKMMMYIWVKKGKEKRCDGSGRRWCLKHPNVWIFVVIVVVAPFTSCSILSTRVSGENKWTSVRH